MSEKRGPSRLSHAARPSRGSVPRSPFPVPVSPDGWPRGSGYSHAISADGRALFIAGQIGWDNATQTLVTGGFVAQTRQALGNIVAVLAAAGAEPAHLVRLTWFVTDRDAYLGAREAIGAAYRDVIGRHFPTMSVIVVSALLEPGAQVEIEATAVIPSSTRAGSSARKGTSTGAKRRPS